jgi:hypothetical protein
MSEIPILEIQLEMLRCDAAALKRSVCPMIQFVMYPP